jgi:hypothetical protein
MFTRVFTIHHAPSLITYEKAYELCRRAIKANGTTTAQHRLIHGTAPSLTARIVVMSSLLSKPRYMQSWF